MRNINDKGYLLIESYIGLLILILICTTLLPFGTFFLTNLAENEIEIEKARMIYDVTLMSGQPTQKIIREINNRKYEVENKDSIIKVMNQEGVVEEKYKVLYSVTEK